MNLRLIKKGSGPPVAGLNQLRDSIFVERIAYDQESVFLKRLPLLLF
jgi:hypothetical protein